MSSNPLHKKLRLESGQSVLVLNAPREYKEIIGILPDGIVFAERSGEEVDFVHLFIKDRSELARFIDHALSSIKYDGLFWISYPKSSSKIETDVNRDILWELLKEKGIRPVTQVSVDDTWSAIRFRPQDAVGR